MFLKFLVKDYSDKCLCSCKDIAAHLVPTTAYPHTTTDILGDLVTSHPHGDLLKRIAFLMVLE